MKSAKKANIQIAPKEAREAEDRTILTLVFLVSGVCGLLSFLGAMRGVAYSGALVYPTAAAVCLFLWFFRYRGRIAFLLGVLAVILGCVIAAFALMDTLWSQLLHLAASLSGDAELEQMNVTELAVLISALLSLFLFVMELLVKGHLTLYLLSTALLLLSPFIGVRLTAGGLLLTILFQGSFWAIQVRPVRRGRKNVVFSGGRGVQKRAAAAAGTLLVAAFLPACLLVSLFSEQFYDSVYDAEGFVYRSLSNLSGRASEPITGGVISRANNYRTGAAHLELTSSSRPTQTLYLRGFGGGIYTGGDWIRSSDEALFENMETAWEWNDSIASVYYSMYFVMNQNTLVDTPPTPVSLTIRHSGGVYGNAYVPYYSQRQRSWGGYGGSGSGTDGYTYRFYEQKDMHIDWKNVDEPFEEARDRYLTLQKAYMAEIQTAYTLVPAELLPRLTKLVEEHPLDDLNDITAFILYTLHSNTVYTLTPGWAPLNEDIVEYFVFEGQRGYCVHFAAAASLMYRLYGVPARYATGYMVSPDAFTLQEDGNWTATATDEDAHAWAEIFLPEYGWTPVEVTPASDGSIAASYPGFDRLEFDRRLMEHRWNMDIPSLPTRSEAYPDKETDVFFPVPEFDLAAHRDLLLIAGVCLGYSLLLLPFFLDYRRMRRRAMMKTMSCRMIFTRLLALLQYCNKLEGVSGTEPDFAERLSASVPALPLEDAMAFTEQVKAAAYGPDGGGYEDCGLALRIYRDAAEALYRELPWYRKLVFRLIKAF